MTENEMVGWHHKINRHEFEPAPGIGEGQMCCSLVCRSPRSHSEPDTIEQLNRTGDGDQNHSKEKEMQEGKMVV